MSRQLVSEEISQIVQHVNAHVQLHVEEGGATKVASSLRQLSRELRYTSKALRLRNLEVMKDAESVAARYLIAQ